MGHQAARVDVSLEPRVVTGLVCCDLVCCEHLVSGSFAHMVADYFEFQHGPHPRFAFASCPLGCEMHFALGVSEQYLRDESSGDSRKLLKSFLQSVHVFLRWVIQN